MKAVWMHTREPVHDGDWVTVAGVSYEVLGWSDTQIELFPLHGGPDESVWMPLSDVGMDIEEDGK